MQQRNPILVGATACKKTESYGKNRCEEALDLTLPEFFRDEDWSQIRKWHPEIARKLKPLRIDRASAEEQNNVAQQISELRNDVASLCLLLTRLEQQFTRATQMKGIHP
ncbi:MAG: hypothetical protein JSW14_06235 [Candidatus Bathyarchaeum sp.]|nr:MAG: hypothetical protein JSW14_06235 [Candidatus Bathyarchaeum sp.]